MHQAHFQQLECLIALSDELHFGRTAERLGLSQSRVSQLVSTLESRIGVRLVDRTSRRVELTRAGTQFVAEVGPAYRSLVRSFARAREHAVRGALQELRIGFTGLVYEEITATFNALHASHGVAVHTRDVPMGSPFADVRSGELDAVLAELPVHDPDLTVGHRFPPQDQLVALAVDHPLAGAGSIDREQLADLDLLGREGDAPGYWKAAMTPPLTPNGRPIPSTASVASVQQGISMAASGRYAMLVCRPVSERHPRTDVRYIPVRGLEKASQLGLVWRTDRGGPALDALAGLLAADESPVAG